MVLGDGAHLMTGMPSRLPSPEGSRLSGENLTAGLCAVQCPLMAVLRYFFGGGQGGEDGGNEGALSDRRPSPRSTMQQRTKGNLILIFN